MMLKTNTFLSNIQKKMSKSPLNIAGTYFGNSKYKGIFGKCPNSIFEGEDIDSVLYLTHDIDTIKTYGLDTLKVFKIENNTIVISIKQRRYLMLNADIVKINQIDDRGYYRITLKSTITDICVNNKLIPLSYKSNLIRNTSLGILTLGYIYYIVQIVVGLLK